MNTGFLCESPGFVQSAQPSPPTHPVCALNFLEQLTFDILLNTPLFKEMFNTYNTYIHAKKCCDTTFSWFLETLIGNMFSWQPDWVNKLFHRRSYCQKRFGEILDLTYTVLYEKSIIKSNYIVLQIQNSSDL